MNKDISLFVTEFLYRIRYKIILGSLLVTCLVAYFSRFLPEKYTVQTSIYTGIASSTGLSEDKLGYFEINNLFDNIINLTKAKGTLEKVSIRLFALNMIKGDPETDNLYMTAESFNELLEIVPAEIKELIDTTSVEKTVENLLLYKNQLPGNFLFKLFNNNHKHYSYNALKNLIVRRVGNSDIIDLSYTADDPGIALNTLKIVNEELINAYEGFKYQASNDVVAYYEEQLSIIKRKLNHLENDLTNYNVENGVINYSEQTKAIAISYSDYENRLNQTKQDYESSLKLIKELELQMGIRATLMKSNADFVAMLDTLSTRNAKITEIEIFSTDKALENNEDLVKYKEQLSNTERSISRISNDMNKMKISKEGVAIEDMVNHWLTQMVLNVKAKAELKVLNDRKNEFVEQYRAYSPVGAEINRREREIRITEESYLEVLHGLNLAKLKQKNIQLSSATLNVVSEPTFPINGDGMKRLLLTVAAFFGSIFFIIFIYIIVELLDRTLRDPNRTYRLTNIPVLSVFTGFEDLKYRGYTKACHRICSDNLMNRVKTLLKKESPIYVNILSIQDKEGKTFVSNYLMNSFKENLIDASFIQYEKDFDANNINLNLSENILDLVELDDALNKKVIITEFGSINEYSIPVNIVKKADLNILVMNSKKVWTESDDVYLNLLKSIVKDNNRIFICLNNTSREVAESFIGQIPPYNKKLRNVSYNFLNLGLTSAESGIVKRIK